MNRISSRWTLFYKWLFPLFVLGILVLAVGALLIGAAGQFKLGEIVIFLVIALIPTTIAFAFAWWFGSRLVDEVWDGGFELLVRNDAKEDRIPIDAIETIDYSLFIQPQQVTLRLDRASAFGASITFLPLYRVFQLSMPPIVEDLRRRIADARQSPTIGT